jgi:hypothetical protein
MITVDPRCAPASTSRPGSGGSGGGVHGFALAESGADLVLSDEVTLSGRLFGQ